MAGRGVSNGGGFAANVPRLFAFRFLRDFLLVMPAIVPVYRASGLDATAILAVQAVFSLAALVFEIPSGYLVDRFGRRWALRLGAACMAAGLGAYGVADRFVFFAAAEVVLAFGYSLLSGTESALLFDSLRADGAEARYRGLEGRAEALTRLGSAVSAAAGGLLAGIALRLPFLVNAATALLMLLLAIGLAEPPRPPLDPRTPARQILRIARETAADRALRPYLILGSVLFAVGVIGIWGAFLRLTSAGISVLSYGVFFAVFQAASAAGAAGSERLSRRLGPVRSWAALALIPLVMGLCALSESAWPVLLTPLAAAAWGFSTPLLLAAMHPLIPSERRATTLSVAAMGGRILFVVLGPVFGLLVDRLSDRAGFAALAGVFVVGAVWAAACHSSAADPRSRSGEDSGAAKETG